MDHYQRSLLNTFNTHQLDRASHRRLDDHWINDRLADPTTRLLPVWQLKTLVSGSDALSPVFLSSPEAQDIRTAYPPILLGLENDCAFFALALSEEDRPPGILTQLGTFQDLRQSAPLLTPGNASLVAYARAIVYWHSRHRFCGDCGSPTTVREAGHMRECTNPDCAQRHFPRTDPAIIVLVTHQDRCLLGRKPSWPPGMYSTIAGFVEPGECIEHAVQREVREETGIEVAGMHYQSSQPWPFPSSLMLGFRADASSTAIHVGQDELEDALWISRDELYDRLVSGTIRLPTDISISRRLIEGWYDEGHLGALADVQTKAERRT